MTSRHHPKDRSSKASPAHDTSFSPSNPPLAPHHKKPRQSCNDGAPPTPALLLHRIDLHADRRIQGVPQHVDPAPSAHHPSRGLPRRLGGRDRGAPDERRRGEAALEVHDASDDALSQHGARDACCLPGAGAGLYVSLPLRLECLLALPVVEAPLVCCLFWQRMGRCRVSGVFRVAAGRVCPD